MSAEWRDERMWLVAVNLKTGEIKKRWIEPRYRFPSHHRQFHPKRRTRMAGK